VAYLISGVDGRFSAICGQRIIWHSDSPPSPATRRHA
jgi:hypothetical protein